MWPSDTRAARFRSPAIERFAAARPDTPKSCKVEYDPARVSFEQLLDVFWQIHDPTTLNRQGPDVGTQYRSIVFYSDEHERIAAEESKQRLDQSGKLGRPVVTQIAPAAEFYRAEEYHQRYYERMGIAPTCGIHGRAD